LVLRYHGSSGETNQQAYTAPGNAGYSYGIWHNWEFSLQLPAAFGQDASSLEGYRAELQYVAPHDAVEGFYWGLNFELAKMKRLGEPRFWNMEVIPIFGYRLDRWHLVANPGLDKAVSGALAP